MATQISRVVCFAVRSAVRVGDERVRVEPVPEQRDLRRRAGFLQLRMRARVPRCVPLQPNTPRRNGFICWRPLLSCILTAGGRWF